MIKLPRSQSTQIKNVLYPEHKKMDKAVHQKNIQALKSKQITNRQKKEEIENSVPAEPYKLKQFKQVESKLAKTLLGNNNPTCENNNNTNYRSENQYSRGGAAASKNTTKNDYNSNTTINKNLIRKNSNPLPGLKNKQKLTKEAIAAKKDSKVNDSAEYVVFQNPNHNVLPDYHEVLKNSKNKNANAQKIHSSNKRLAEEEEENIFNLGKPQVKSLERENAGNNYGSDEDNFRNESIEDNDYAHLENLHQHDNQEHNKAHNNRNYILENRQKVINHDIPQKSKPKEENKGGNPIHKSFGKIPNYLQKFKQDAEDKKELEKKLAEEAKYPKGTRLLSEGERLETLNNLLNTRKELINLLEKMPISMRTVAIQTKKAEMEKKLNEIEDGIKTFSRKQVFVKIDNY